MTQDQDACGLVQIRHTVPGAILYQSYWYRSGVNQTMTRNLHSIAARRRGPGRPRPPATWSSTSAATTARSSTATATRDLRYLGFDPSDVTRYAIEKGYDVVRDFFSARSLRQRYPDRRAKVITSIAMFYDLEDPAAFVRDVADSLAEDGVWVMELHYLPLMLQQNAFDVIVHEHLEYYSLAVLERLFAEAGLEVVDGELNDINGGSIRLFIAHAGRREAAPAADGAPAGAARARVRDGARLAGALRGVRAQRRARRARAEAASASRSSPTARRSTSTAPRPRATRSSSTPTSTAG